MATKRSKRTHTKTVGTKPHTGRRYVKDGKVRIEWYEDGKRRSRTIGPHTPEVRAEADAKLEELLAGSQTETATAASTGEPEPASGDWSFRGLALMLLDAADQAADGLENAAQYLMREFVETPDKPGQNGDTQEQTGPDHEK